MNQQPLDIVGIIMVLLAFIVSKDVAMAVSPYAAIVVLACAGSVLALSGAEQKVGTLGAIWFVAGRILVAVAITISLAELFQRWVPDLQPRYTLAPIAFGIGWIRDYNQVRATIGGLLARILNKRIDDGK